MQDWIIAIIIGLLFLTFLEFALLLIIAAAKCAKEPQQKPKLVIPEPSRPERYEWEDSLDALSAKSEQKPPEKSSGKGKMAVILLILLAVIALPSAAFLLGGIGSIPTDLSRLPEYAASAMLLQESTIEDLLSLERPYLKTIGYASFAMLLALAVFIYTVERQRAKIVHKAKNTADKLIKKAEKTAAEKQKKTEKGGIGQYAFPILLLICLLAIGVLLYLFRDQILAELPALARQDYAATAINFLQEYKYYIIGGVLALIAEIAIILKITSGKKDA